MATSEGKQRPKRVTVDLDPVDYESLRGWAYQERMSHSDVLRSLVNLLTNDPEVASQIRRSERQAKS